MRIQEISRDGLDFLTICIPDKVGGGRGSHVLSLLLHIAGESHGNGKGVLPATDGRGVGFIPKRRGQVQL